jgi:phage gp46-like protein
MADVRIFQTLDGGDIEITNGLVGMSEGLDSSAYLSLFGGNLDDSGSQGDERLQWWGNITEPDATRRYRSETQFLLRSLPLVPANLQRFEDAAGRDLAWMIETKIATSIDVDASMPALNTVRIRGGIVVDGSVVPFDFVVRAQKAG